jgi:hypothetical protein
MKINFKCIELTIQDEELGCTVIFSDSKSADDQFKTEDELMKSEEKYFLIQRTYAEDKCDMEYYYIESSESNKGFETSEKIKININDNRVDINWFDEQVIIGLNLKNQVIENLLRILNTKFNELIIVSRK